MNMKKLILIFVISQFSLFSLNAQTSPDDKENLKQVNRQVIASYKARKFDEALKFARQAVDLSVKAFGAEHAETATAYTNLGTIYQSKKKYREAAANLQKALSIYRLKSGAGEKAAARVLNDLALIYVLDGDKKQAEQTYILALASAENAFGKESAEILPFLKSFAEFYAFADKIDEAQELFIRRYLLAAKHFPPEAPQLLEIEDEYYCHVALKSLNVGAAAARNLKFAEVVSSVKAVGKKKIINNGILNGRAIFLPKPEYPANAKAKRATGVIPVRVMIDETGKVTEAKAVCGDMDLQQASEAAAKQAKFAPVRIDGEAVKISGIIVYNFLAG
jgi:TonB family protein